MTATDFTRRAFLAALPALATAPRFALGKERVSVTRVYSAATSVDGTHYLCGWSATDGLFRTAAPSRGHDVLLRGKEVIYIARRPGDWFCVLDSRTGKIRHTRRSIPGRHFYGHGALSADGRYLYTTENNFEQGGAGAIGVYDCRDSYRHIAELPSGGIGPHQLAVMPDGKTLVVANGGILTLPDRPREKLNIDSMQPSLTYIDLSTGKLLSNWQPPHHQLSLRHLDVNASGVVTVGAQFEGPDATALSLPLLFSHRGEGQLQAFLADTPTWRAHRNYIASVASSGDTVLATSPRGSLISRWHKGSWQGSERLNDVAGAAALPQSEDFITSNGRGQLVRVSEQRLALLERLADLRWDNHMSIGQ